MKLALKELKYNWKKYVLVGIIVVLMMFMVLFLSGLVNGLGTAVSSGVDNMRTDYFVMSDDAEKLLTVSNMTNEEYQKLKQEYHDDVTPIDVQRMYIQKRDGSDKIDITYFAISKITSCCRILEQENSCLYLWERTKVLYRSCLEN